MDLHDRIKAGLALGKLDDPRFQRLRSQNKHQLSNSPLGSDT